MPRYRSHLLLIGFSLHALTLSPYLMAATAQEEQAAAIDGYKINFNNVSIVEYIRFVSRITGINFIFEEGDLQFAVTIVSEEPVSSKNVMSTLVQILRIHDLTLLEQDNNLLITRSDSVSQIPKVISEDLPDNKAGRAPIITRVFRIKNGNPATIATIIRPLVSQSALIETLADSRQLIVTDITTNVEKIAELLASLDSPHSPLEIQAYVAQNISLEKLAQLVKQLIAPFTEGNPLILVPQKQTRTLFIVSTPHLIQKALAVMQDIDTPSGGGSNEPLNIDHIFVYKILYRPHLFIENGLKDIASTLEKQIPAPENLVRSLQSVRWVKDSHSLLFFADEESLVKIKEFLATLDTPIVEEESQKSAFYIYTLEHASYEQVKFSMEQVIENLEKAPAPDTTLIATLESMTFAKDTNSVIFTGDSASLEKVKQILPNIDVSSVSLKKASPESSSSFYIYKLQKANAEQVELSLANFSDHLSQSKTPDTLLIDAIRSVKWIKENNSLLFTGDKETLKRLEEILPTFDVVTTAALPAGSTFYIYKIEHATAEQMESSLTQLADHLEQSKIPDEGLVVAIDSVKWIKETNSLLFTGSKEALARLADLLPTFDVASSTPLSPVAPGTEQNKNFLIYSPHYIDGEKIEKQLRELGENLQKSGLALPGLLQTIKMVKWVSTSKTLLFSGSPETLQEIEKILKTIDVPGGTPLVKQQFFIYQPIYKSVPQIEKSLRELAENLEASGLLDPYLLETIGSMRYVESSQSLLFTGAPNSLDKIKELLAQIDTQAPAKIAVIQHVGGLTFLVYRLQYVSAPQLMSSLKSLRADVSEPGSIYPHLPEAIDSMKWIRETNSVVFTGSEHDLAKIEELVKKFDIPSLAGKIPQDRLSVEEAAPNAERERRPPQDTTKAPSSLDTTLSDQDTRTKAPSSLDTTLSDQDTRTMPPREMLTTTPRNTTTSTKREVPTTFVLYRPEYQSGDELISILCDFKQHLIQSGLVDEPLYDTIDHLQWLPKISSLLVPGNQASIDRVIELLRRFDVPGGKVQPAISSFEATSFLVYKLQYHRGEEIEKTLRQIGQDLAKTGPASNRNLANAINSIQWLKITNALVSTGEPQILTRLKELIQNLDIPLKQVFIEILVIETAVSNAQNFGVQWGGRLQYLTRTALGFNNNAPFDSNSVPIGAPFQSQLDAINGTSKLPNANLNFPLLSGFDLGVIGDIIMHKGKSFLSMGSLVNAIQTDADSNIVLNPKLITQDNKNSTIFVGQNVPFVGSVTQNFSSNTTNSTNLEYRDIGFSLSITPTLGDNNIVTLDIVNDISEQVGGPTDVNFSTNQISGITTSHTNMSTRVHVPDRHFLILSGMLKDTKARTRSQVPCLGGIPVIGAAFTQNNRVNSKSNVIFFIRPYIINSFDEYQQITETQEHLYKDEALLPVMKEYVEQGLELVKTPQDE